MNYIKQINAFYNRIEQEPLTSSGVSLWHTLMHINNKAMWRESFTASGTILRLKAGLTESSFKRARKELQEKGYIRWESRGRNLAPLYRMVSLAFDSDDNQDNGYPYKPDFAHDQEAAATVADGIVSLDSEENATYAVHAEGANQSDWRTSFEYRNILERH